MKKLFILILFYNISFSQSIKDKGVVFYGEIKSIRSGPKSDIERISLLVFNKNESSYVTHKDSVENFAPQTIKDLCNTNPASIIKKGKLTSHKAGFQVYSNFLKDSVYSTYAWEAFVYVKELRSKIKWELINETKKIGSFECKKATCFFRGRDYIAWYTEQIPVPYGPWKLQGLPGLILEAYNPEQEIYFEAKNIEFPTESKTEISKVIKPKNEKWLTQKEFVKWSDDRLEEIHQRGFILKVNILRSPLKDVFKEISE